MKCRETETDIEIDLPSAGSIVLQLATVKKSEQIEARSLEFNLVSHIDGGKPRTQTIT